LKVVFVDTAFWVSLLNAVFWETLNCYTKFPSSQRGFVAEQIELFLRETNIEVVTGGKNWLIATTEFYRKRKDKQWSGVDCFSMLVMESKGIIDVLTTDNHFKQAGFNALMVEPQAKTTHPDSRLP
jgi:predicted nucleic-acid-binding protein